MIRSFTWLLTALPIWAQFQPAPPASPAPAPQQVYPPADYPPQQYQAQAQYPPQQQPYPSSQPPYPAQQPYPTQQPYPAQGGDQEGRDFATDQQHGVARLRIAQGDVNVKRGDNGLLTGAIMNAPLLSHDHLETGPGSRAEVELDNANVVRLAQDSDLGFANLVFGRSQLQLGIGTIIFRVLRDSQAQIEIDTPSVGLHPLGQGDYRISVFDNGTSQITVRAGRLEMFGPRGTQTVEPGQSVMIRGDAADPEFQQAYPPQRDQFDDWSAGRDSEMKSSRSAQYVGADVYGTEDLDRYGNWVPSQYGQVWAPQGQPADWSPYSNGQWTYVDYYGWTWVGYEPWGWAPYHHGRWFYNTGVGWCWWPGLRVGLGFNWSPALVSFFGFGGGLGWIALAPFELFHPWWGHAFGYGGFHGDVFHSFRNAAIRGGAITAGFGSFAGVGHRFSPATSSQLRSASIYRGSIPVSPNGAGYRFTDRAVSANPRLSQAASRTFFSRSQQSLNGGRANSYAAGGGGGGWQRFGSPAPQRQQMAPQSFSSRPNGNTESGWHNFGAPRYNAPSAPGNAYRAPSSSNYGGYRAPSTPNFSGYRAPSTSSYSYRAPAVPHNSAPAAQHYSAPKGNSGGGGGGKHYGGGGGGGSKHHGR